MEKYNLSRDEFHVITGSGVYSGGDGLRYLSHRYFNIPQELLNNPVAELMFQCGYRGVAENRSRVSDVYFMTKELFD
jgi:hypothetical protein